MKKAKGNAKTKAVAAKVSWPVKRIKPEAVGLCPKRLERVKATIGGFVDEGRVSGAITVVARRGRIAHLECFGAADLETRRPMTDDTIFRIYSMTKIVTSVAALMLAEEGHFLFTSPLAEFIPEFKDVQVEIKKADGQTELVPPRREVIVHDLFVHMAGLGYDHDGMTSSPTLQEFVAKLCRKPLMWQPGEKWEYSSASDVLGRLIEVVSGKPFDVFLKERIFEPLGMTDTGFWVPPEKAARLATMYKDNMEGGQGTFRLKPMDDLLPQGLRKGRPFYAPPLIPSGGGGLVSTTSDFLRFSLMLLNDGELNGVRLLSPTTVELMTSDALPHNYGTINTLHWGFGYGLGVSVVRRLGEYKQYGSVGTFGWGGAACTQVWIDPAEEMVCLIMMQHLANLPAGERFPVQDLFKQTAYQAIVE
jgi:CubicO group peptidase (beta-lactamase class C family)